ncbi:hypothetical protein [Neisseria sp. HMSC072C05]|uniref:hypothetical protein n=1 Tax=unclassified Neisseria TaxID=2623750 RepID=UPI0008A5B8E2|nr:hypothetical protein [Neisseria sp. HMSC072C05]OFM99570.1 hypothetical protein HMPREF2633_05525 [Neisseria sp. HMSC072C05]
MLFYGYQVKSDHRDNSHRKSQWKICEIDELKIFTFGFCNNWCSKENDVLWSCSENFQAIGVESQENKNAGSPYDKLYFARFTKDAQHIWHGFPISQYNQNDEVPKSIKLEVGKYFSTTEFKDKFNKWMKGKL